MTDVPKNGTRSNSSSGTPRGPEPAGEGPTASLPVTRRVGITETALRDAHQSIMATRLRTEDMLPVAEKMDDVGYHSLEVWGGATFDSAMRFLDEDPWERLRLLRKCFKKTKLQMLLRGQNLLGYRHYADDVVVEFVKRAVGNGIDIIRCFDALNDLRNLETAAAQVKKEGAHLQLAISYTISPVHTTKAFEELAFQMKAMGADSICIKDMAGLLSPSESYPLVKGIKERTGLPVQVHSHYTTGLAAMSYFEACRAGADVVDCAISPLSMGTSQPATEAMVAALAGTPYDTGLDLERLVPVAEHFRHVREHYSKLVVDLHGVDINILRYQIPGGMYSNLVSQLKEQNALDKLDAVLREVPQVRMEMGYPPLVTPTSQIVGTQATLNVLVGERWKVIPKEVKNYFLGYYGRPPAPVDEEIRGKAIGDEKAIEGRPGEHLRGEMADAVNAAGVWALQPEDYLSYVLFPAVAKDFLPRKFSKVTYRNIGLGEAIEGVAYPL
ncbi:pyruvate carboxylase subunit B [Aminithiophilus ramosus]|uniref:Pyruvate carboxylase subunit B n=2 Tax=Synergistales TaxID=649776 RepID=A0A9Q7AD38_9BACT|nr:pyruvate carboxylase subunit B [Aminithiophilus ramosus]QVL35079.1 pyruvate carboxylase subunit B [Synergistota bacterium]